LIPISRYILLFAQSILGTFWSWSHYITSSRNEQAHPIPFQLNNPILASRNSGVVVFLHLLHNFECEVDLPQAAPGSDSFEVLRQGISILLPDRCRPDNEERKEQACYFPRSDLAHSCYYPLNSRLDIKIRFTVRVHDGEEPDPECPLIEPRDQLTIFAKFALWLPAKEIIPDL